MSSAVDTVIISAPRAKAWIAWAFSAVLGGGIALATHVWGGWQTWPVHVWRVASWAYDQVGVVLIGLTPLCIWLTCLIYKQLGQSRETHIVTELDYDFIARQATSLGLLGTVISLLSACLKLSGEVAQGSAAAVLQIIPLVGQAVVSTAVGLVIAIFAQIPQHLLERRRLRK